jgi:POT family proton-dependent oligopeptide transporter
MMGVSLLSSSFAHHLGGFIAKLTLPSITSSGNQGLLTKLASYITGFNTIEQSTVTGIRSLAMSTTVFAQIGIISIIAAFIILLFSPLIKKLMHGIH